jgi:integrase
MKKENRPSENAIIDLMDSVNALLSSGSGEKEGIVAQIKAAYVKEHHDHPIVQTKNGEYRTYIGHSHKTRRLVQRAREKDLINYLYEYYKNGEKKPITLRGAEDAFIEYKRDVLNIDADTAKRLQYLSGFFKEIENRELITLTRDELRTFIHKKVMEEHPREYKIKAVVQLLHGSFRYAVEAGEIQVDVTGDIQPKEFFKDCDNTKKTAREKIFLPEDIEKITASMKEIKDNPRALAVRLSILTGMRSAEIVALKWEDIRDTSIHIHRQQKLLLDENGHRVGYVELPYTKDERRHPHGGRLFPRTPEINEVLEDAKLCCPISNNGYIFTDDQGEWISKNSYELFLKRQMRKLGYTITNNHSFRMSLNSNVLLRKGVSPANRAFILGHSVETNERYYSYTRDEQVDEIGRLIG